MTEQGILARSSSFLLVAVGLLGLYSMIYRDLLPLAMYVWGAVLLVPAQLVQLHRGNILTVMTTLPLSLLVVVGVLICASQPLPDLPRFPRFVLTAGNSAVTLGSVLTTASVFLLGVGLMGPKYGWSAAFNHDVLHARREMWVICLLLVCAVVLSVLTVPGDTILSAAYATAEQRTGRIIDSAGLKIVAIGTLTSALAIAAWAFGLASRNYKAVALVVLSISVYFYFLRGDRGGTLPVLITLMLLYVMMSSDSVRRKITVSVSLGSLAFIILVMMSFFRASAAKLGVLPALGESASFAMDTFAGADHRSKSGLLGLPLLPQSIWHGLHTADLYQRGISLGGRSFLELLPQSLPKFFTDLVGYERPLNGAWHLARYRLHGGGMNSVALAYWNLGVAGVMFFAGGMAVLVSLLENWYRKQVPALLGGYVLIAGSMPYVMLYGWQPMIKMIEIAFFLSLIIGLGLYGGRRVRRRRVYPGILYE